MQQGHGHRYDRIQVRRLTMYAPNVEKQTSRPQKSCSVPPRPVKVEGTPTMRTLRTVSKSSNQSVAGTFIRQSAW